MNMRSLKLALVVLAFSTSFQAFSAWDFFQTYIIVDRGSGNEFYAGSYNADGAAQHVNRYYGNFQAGSTFVLNGAELKTYKNGNSNVCGGTLWYRVYRNCDTPGAFSSINIAYNGELGGGDQRWQTSNANINILTGLQPGHYALEVYWQADGNENNPSGCGEPKYDGNGGANWIAYFDYDQLDSFRDNNINLDPVWSGDTGSWGIQANSDVAAGATGSYTLRLAAPAVTQVDHLSTPFSNWLDEQTWSFFFGRRAQGLTAANRIDIWLYANEANLESATVDGYRIRMGDDSAPGDEIYLESVTNGVGTAIITGPAITNGLTDYGIAFKITRSNIGTWTLYTSTIPLSNGTGVVASNCALELATINQGSVVNTLYSISGTGYFGFAATHTISASGIVANEFDQIRIKGNVNAPVLGCTNAGACNYNPAATQDDGSCEFLTCVGCTNQYALNYDNTATIDDGSCVYPDIVISELHYNPDDVAGYTDTNYEFFEIYNNEAFSVDLSGWNFVGVTYTFPAATSIAAGEYIVLALNAATYTGNGYQVFQYTGGLNNSGEIVQLLTPNSAIVDEVTYDDANPWPLSADGFGPSAELLDVNFDNNDGNNWFAYTLNGTPGGAPLNIPGCLDPSAANYSNLATVEDGSCVYGPASIVINEIHYNPCGDQGNDTDFEFLELYNASGASVDISGWEVVGFDYTFPALSSMAAGEYIIVAATPASYTGNGYQVFGPIFGGLLNTGEAISLLDNLGNYIDYVSYATSSPWPDSPNGGCASLELGGPNNNNYDVNSWQGSYVEYGTPGGPNSAFFECVDCADPSAVSVDELNEDFESGTLTWDESIAGDWTVSGSSPISGTYSLKHNLSGVSGASEVTADMECLIYDGLCTTWRFEVGNGAWDPEAGDRFLIHLAATEQTLNSATVDGYAVGVNYNGATDRIGLYRITDGAVASVLMESSFDMNASEILGIEVQKNNSGQWMLRIDRTGGFDNLLAASSAAVSDLTYLEGRYFGVRFEFATPAAAGAFRVDNVNVSQCGIETIYYSVSSGNTGDAIWSTNDLDVVGQSITFTRYKRLVIQTGHTVTTTGRVIADDMSTENGGTLVGNASPYDIILYGNFINDGSFDPGSSTVKLKGSSPQLIAGANSIVFNKLSMENPTSASIASVTSIRNVLYPNKGNLISSGNLTLLDDATYTGYVAPFGNGATISGEVIHQTYLQATMGAGWTLAGPATSGLNIEDWNDDLITTGFTGSDYPLANFINLAVYEESVPGTRNLGYVFPTSTLDLLNENKAYYIYEFANAITLDAAGPVRNGSITLPLDHTNTGFGPNDGWNLVYNIYPAPVDLEALVSNSDPSIGVGPETATTFYMWNTFSNSYQIYQAVTMTGTAPRFVAPSQGFFVNVSASHLDFQFDEWIKDVDQTGLNILREDPAFPKITLALHSDNSSDEAYLLFRDGASAGFESMDALKLYSFNESAANFAFVNQDGEDLVIDARAVEQLSEGLSVPVFINALAGGSMEISLKGLDNMTDNICISLEDLHTGEVYPLSEGDAFSFVAEEQTSFARFVLHLSPVVSSQKADLTCFNAHNGSISAQSIVQGEMSYTWYNENNQVIASEISAQGSSIQDLSAGSYFLVIAGENLLCAESVITFEIVEPLAETVDYAQQIAACNQQNDGRIELSLTNVDSFNWAINGEGLSNNGSSDESVLVFDVLAAGNYTISVNTACSSWNAEFDLSDPMAVDAQFSASAQVVQLYNGAATVDFNALANGADTYLWNFGDGASANLQNPTHTYTEEGVYVVALSASNQTCSDLAELEITVQAEVVSIDENQAPEVLVSYSQSFVQLSFENWTEGNFTIRLHDTTGKLVMNERLMINAGSTWSLPLEKISAGAYQISINNDIQTLFSTKIVK
jgi:PKD repeat protein